MYTVMQGIRVAAVLGCLVVAAGCAKAPEQDIEMAKQALEEARQAGAPIYAPETFREAETSFRKAMEEIAAQETRLAPLRSYATSQELLAQVKQVADQATSGAVMGKEKAKTDTSQAVTQARMTVEEAKILLAKAPTGKGTQADIQAMRGDLKAAEQMLGESQSLMTLEDYAGAKAKAETARQAATQVAEQVKKAAVKTQQKVQPKAQKKPQRRKG
ncbi:MAG: hypothetical protein ACREI3_10645 [Nitrospirales bacterium]